MMDQAPFSATASQKLRSACRAPSFPPSGQPIGGDRGIHRARAGTHDSFDGDAPVLEMPVESTPSESAVRPASLQSQINLLATGAGSGIRPWVRLCAQR